MIRLHYGFQSTGAYMYLLDFAEIRLNENERFIPAPHGICWG